MPFPLGLAAAFLGLVLASQACSSEDESAESGPASGLGGSGGAKGGTGGSSPGGSSSGGTSASGAAGTGGSGVELPDAGIDPDAFFVNDPPPPSCDGGPLNTPVIGGTPDCPDDKNREGCPCDKPGEEAPCWPGYRKHRSRGICKDGTTVCKAVGETSAVWGKCDGYVLPKPNPVNSKERCECFSGGQWKLNNLSPCFVSDSNKKVIGAVSTVETGPGQAQCPPIKNPLAAPPEPFSTNSLTVDCAGHFKLCYTLRAGKAETASPADCIVAQVCAEADYNEADTAQPFPPLPSWVTSTPEQVACAQQFASSGGYGEMTVVGVSVECDTVEEQVFNRVNYCPLTCSQNPQAPGCEQCMNGGSGSFLSRQARRAAPPFMLAWAPCLQASSRDWGRSSRPSRRRGFSRYGSPCRRGWGRVSSEGRAWRSMVCA